MSAPTLAPHGQGRDVRVGNIAVDLVIVHPHNIRRDLGDLRPLQRSIEKYGLMQPVVVEKYGNRWRLRAGHRRAAAAKLAGLKKIPAIIHPAPLEDDEWLMQSVQENVLRRQIDRDERREVILKLRDLGCTWDGVAETFGGTIREVKRWAKDHDDPPPRNTPPPPRMHSAKKLNAFITNWREISAQDDSVTAATILDALEAALAPAPPTVAANQPDKQAA